MNTERYNLAKKEVLDFFDKLKIPEEKYDLTEQPPRGKSESFTVSFTVEVDIKDILTHNFRYSRIEDREYYMTGTIVYFAVRKNRKGV